MFNVRIKILLTAKYMFYNLLIVLTLIQSGCSDMMTSTPKDSYDIILVIGQSNTLAGNGGDIAIGINDIKQLGRFNENNMQVIEATEPLDHHSKRANHIGFAMTFARLYEKEMLASNRHLLMIPCGKGGTGFYGHFWNKGDTLYQDAVDRVKYCLEKFPSSRVIAILWHQGESDVDNPHYQADLDSMIENIRADINAPSVPFILGGMVPYWVQQDEKRIRIQSIIQSTPTRIDLTEYADPTIPSVISKVDDNVDIYHYDADGQRELGKRYFDAFKRLLGN